MRRRLWLRATTHCICVSDVLAPGEAVELDPNSPQHRAIVDEIAIGADCPVELVEAEHDPSATPPPDEYELRSRRAADAAAALAASHRCVFDDTPAAEHSKALRRAGLQEPDDELTPTSEGDR